MNKGKILDLVAAIGATDDAGEIRRTTLEILRKIVWFDTANFWLYPPFISQAQDALVTMDLPQNCLNLYLQHYIDLDDFHQAYNRNSLLIARSTDLLNYSRWTQQNEYYNEFLKGNFIHYLLGFDIKDDYMAYGAICLHREKYLGDFNNNDLLMLRLIYPHLVNRLRWLYERQSLLSRLEACLTTEVPHKIHYFDLLTVREREIVQQVLSSKSNQEIAKNMGLSINTVKMHLQNIYIKLGIKRRSQLFTM